MVSMGGGTPFLASPGVGSPGVGSPGWHHLGLAHLGWHHLGLAHLGWGRRKLLARARSRRCATAFTASTIMILLGCRIRIRRKKK